MTSISKPTPLDVTTRHGRERVREVWTGAGIKRLSSEELEAAKRAGYEPGESNERLIGRDPRLMTTGDLRAMGLEAMSPMEAIRAKCLDCTAVCA